MSSHYEAITRIAEKHNLTISDYIDTKASCMMCNIPNIYFTIKDNANHFIIPNIDLHDAIIHTPESEHTTINLFYKDLKEHFHYKPPFR